MGKYSFTWKAGLRLVKRSSGQEERQQRSSGDSNDSITVSGGKVEKDQALLRDRERQLSGTNEHYGERGPDGDPRAYTHNCQRCTFAYEMRMRGYDVEASEYIGNDEPVMNGWRRAFDGMQYESAGATRKSNVVRAIQDKLDEYGPKSRAIVYVAWDGGSAHVFNVGNMGDGMMWSHDPQTGRTNVLPDYATRVKPSRVLIARVDNLNPSKLYLDGAVRRKRDATR